MKLEELKIDETNKKIIALTTKQRRLAEIAAKLGLAYSTTHQRMMILQEKGYINKIKTMSGKTLYIKNPKVTL